MLHFFSSSHIQLFKNYYLCIQRLLLVDIMSTSTKHSYHRISEDNRITIIALKEKGYTLEKIADQTKISLPSIEHVLQKWKLHHTVKDLPKMGRPHIGDNRTRRQLVRMIQNNEIKTAEELTKIANQFNIVRISSRTARRELHTAGMKLLRMIKKPLLTKEHRRKRLEFARSHANWTVNDWKNVIFSDESIITSRSVLLHELKWTKPTHDLNPQLVIPVVQGSGPQFMVWGCISKFGVHDLTCIEGNLDSTGYVKILKDNLLPIIKQYFGSNPYYFQQDGAAIHNANMVLKFFDNKKISHLTWPPHSPDLNIIEDIWHYIKERLRKMLIVTSKEKLWSNVGTVMNYMWSEEMTKKINKLYESMPDRIKAVIDAHGGNTTY